MTPWEQTTAALSASNVHVLSSTDVIHAIAQRDGLASAINDARELYPDLPDDEVLSALVHDLEQLTAAIAYAQPIVAASIVHDLLNHAYIR